jgi:cyclophilin family peptidyl-prolyl cis-trans isomerase
MRFLLVLAALGCATAPDAHSRRMSAFTLGQLGTAWQPISDDVLTHAEAELCDHLLHETDPEVRDRIVEALGKLRGPRGVDVLAGELAGTQRARAAIALGLRARNKQGAPAAVPRLAELLHDGDAEVRWAAAYALGQQKLPAAHEPLLGCLGDAAAPVRAVCAKGLADVGNDGDSARLAQLVDDSSPLVAAEAARTLAKLAQHCGDVCPPLAALASSRSLGRPQVVEAIAFEPLVHPAARELYRGLFERLKGPLQCKAALGHDRAAATLELTPRCEADETVRAMLGARALGQAKGNEDDRARALIELAHHKAARVRMAAAEALGEIDREAVADPLLALLADSDLGVLESAAGAIEKRKIAAAAPGLVSRLPDLDRPDAIEAEEAVLSALGALRAPETGLAVRAVTQRCRFSVCLAAIDALEKIAGEKVPFRPLALETGEWAAEPLPAQATVELATARGRIVVRLFPADAPSNVRSFLHLVRRGYFDGLTFHRVVPDFVSQGGDPRGDGSGGPGWALPCEINLHRYHEGSMGMALAGRDTGGSQFFFAHGTLPHLDGRYTIFGEIVEGKDVAENLIEGDVITRARLIQP